MFDVLNHFPVSSDRICVLSMEWSRMSRRGLRRAGCKSPLKGKFEDFNWTGFCLMAVMTLSTTIDTDHGGRVDHVVQQLSGASRSHVRGMIDHSCVSITGAS